MSSNAASMAKMFEKKAREAAEPPGKKDVVWYEIYNEMNLMRWRWTSTNVIFSLKNSLMSCLGPQRKTTSMRFKPPKNRRKVHPQRRTFLNFLKANQV